MRKELKRQIKQNELVTTYQRAAAWSQAHARELKVGLVAALIGGTLVLGWRLFHERRKDAARAAYTKALETYHAPAKDELGPGEQPPSALVHSSAAERWRKARDEFESVVQRYGSLDVGRRARYYAALCRLELGETAEAEKVLGELARHRDRQALEPSLARTALAEAHRAAGRVDKAVEEYRQMVDDGSFALPRDHALMKLAALLEEARRPQEAQATYRRLVEEYPSSVYAPEARQRAAYLVPAVSGQPS